MSQHESCSNLELFGAEKCDWGTCKCQMQGFQVSLKFNLIFHNDYFLSVYRFEIIFLKLEMLFAGCENLSRGVSDLKLT